MLELIGVTKAFGHHAVLDRISASLQPHAIHFLMGPNGSGKTTLVRCILGLHRFEGAITWRGRPLDPSDRVICPVFDDPPLHARLTGAQNMAVLVPEAVRRQERRYLTDHVLRSRVSGYSHGQRMRLALTMALNSGAELIVLDEPTNGLDREAMRRLAEDMAEMSSSTTFIVTGHNLEFYDSVIDTLHVIRDGKVVPHPVRASTTEGGASLADVYDENFPPDRQ